MEDGPEHSDAAVAGPGDDGIPDAFFCPITADYMTDPVVTSDGQTYERAAIERWLDRQRARQLPATSPLTGEALEHTQLVPNVALRGLVRDLLERRPELKLVSGTGAAFANL